MPMMTADLNFIISCDSQLLPPDVVQHVARQTCAGLAYMHRSGVVHGDIKPANLLVDDNWRLRIADFGSAHNVRSPAPRRALPTLWYRAPELFDEAAPVSYSGLRFYLMFLLIRMLMHLCSGCVGFCLRGVGAGNSHTAAAGSR